MELSKLFNSGNGQEVFRAPLPCVTQTTSSERAVHAISTVFQGTTKSSLYCDETLDDEEETVLPLVQQERSFGDLKELEAAAKSHRHCSGMVGSLQALIGKIDEKIAVTDFSNGYEEGLRNQLGFTEMDSLFRMFITVQDYFEQRCGYLKDDKRSPEVQRDFKAWFDVEMRSLVTRILSEVAKNNQESRRGQLAAYPQISWMRSYICDRIGALDQESNPTGWKEVAIDELEKLLTSSFGSQYIGMNPKKQEVIEIIRRSLNLLKYYS
jgi:hypothetical protein